jgi:GNAT superfamily N-acetyltransferase
MTTVIRQPLSDNQAEPFTVRPLSADDSVRFKAVRLEALHLDAKVFAASCEEEERITDAEWRERATPRYDHCWFGVFKNGHLVGITQALTWCGDKSGQTALFRSSYLMPEYRGEGAASSLCRIREEWALKNSSYTAAMLFHREGHWVATVIEDFGAVYSHTETMRFADGAYAPALWYRKMLKAC